MDGLMGGDSEFGRLIQQAAKLKGHQMSQDRKRYETWPKYLQHTMYSQEQLQETRRLDAAERLARAVGWKNDGNALLKGHKYDEAMSTYEKSLGLWRYVHNRQADWKKKGIKDEDVSIVDDTGMDAGHEIARGVRELKLSCLLNISLAAQRMRDFNLAARACTDALELDDSSTKALYRRAGAYAAMGSATEADMAIRDLQRAHKLDPNDKLIAKQLKGMLAERQKNKANDTATFGGMFERGSMEVPEDEHARGTGGALTDGTSSEQGSADVGPEGHRKYTNMQELADDMAKMKDAIAAAEYNGNNPEARMLRQRLANVESIVEKAREKALESARQKALPNWSNPSEADILDAKKHGLDLTDKDVQAELIRLSKVHANKGSADDKIQPSSASDSNLVNWRRAAQAGLFAMIFCLLRTLYSVWKS